MELETAKNFRYKSKTVIPDMESIDPNIWYAFTLNPCDKYQHFSAVHRIADCIKDLETILFYKHARYTLYPEISKKGRVHYHGYIQIFKPFHFYLHSVNYILHKGTVVIKPIDNEQVWETYCTKQEKIMCDETQLTFNTYPIKYYH